MCEQVNEFHVVDERRGSKKSVGSRMTDIFLSSLGVSTPNIAGHSCGTTQATRLCGREPGNGLVTFKAHTKTAENLITPLVWLPDALR